MKLIIALSCLLAGSVAIQQPLKYYMVSYADDTPPSVLDAAKDNILAAGGKIVHEFDILTGFIADTTSEVMNKVQKLSAEHQPTIEEDSTVHTRVV